MKIGEKLSANLPDVKDKTYLQFLGKRNLSSIVIQPTDEYEVIKIISSLNNRKWPGVIDITISLIKEAKFVIAGYLTNSVNECLELSIYPDALNTAKVIAPQKGGSKLNLGNYRPISILSSNNKVVDTILHKRLSSFWEKYNLFSNYQFGFRKQHSTNHAITFLNKTAPNIFDNNRGICGIFLDFAKAFDCVNHEVLLNKLEHHGVRGNVLSLLRSYLSNRFQYTEKRELQITSHQLPITIGVPPGSVLGPFLFLVYINDLPNSCDSAMILYADDSVLLCTDPSVKKLQTKTETEFRKLENWIKLNRLSLNYKKTSTISFSRKKTKPLDDNFSIYTEKAPIEVKNTIKYLGVLIDSKLSWTNHIHHIGNKLSVARRILLKIKHFASKSVLQNVDFGLAYPYLQYGVTSWETLLSNIQKS